MVCYKYEVPPIKIKNARKSMTIPDQSMSIREIVERFVRGIPVDVIQRQGVYMDQDEHDFEKLNRMDFAEKKAYADAMQARAEAIQSDLEESERAKRESERRRAQERSQQSASRTGIDPLDNTMPVDTGTDNQGVSRTKV